MAERKKSSEVLTRQELAISNAYEIAALVTGPAGQTPPGARPKRGAPAVIGGVVRWSRPRLPGWPLEFRANAESREMITGPGDGASQNPAYRPVSFSSCRW